MNLTVIVEELEFQTQNRQTSNATSEVSFVCDRISQRGFIEEAAALWRHFCGKPKLELEIPKISCMLDVITGSCQADKISALSV